MPGAAIAKDALERKSSSLIFCLDMFSCVTMVSVIAILRHGIWNIFENIARQHINHPHSNTSKTVTNLSIFQWNGVIWCLHIESFRKFSFEISVCWLQLTQSHCSFHKSDKMLHVNCNSPLHPFQIPSLCSLVSKTRRVMKAYMYLTSALETKSSADSLLISSRMPCR